MARSSPKLSQASVSFSMAMSGTGTSSVYGDERAVQEAPSQLPAGGFLFIQAQAQNASNTTLYTGGGDIVVQSGADHQPLPENFGYGNAPTTSQLSTIALSDSLLSGSGFSQVSLHTSGAVTVEANANVSLAAGGVFDVLAGRKITIDGSVSVPSGNITLVTFDSRSISAGGSVFLQRQQVSVISTSQLMVRYRRVGAG